MNIATVNGSPVSVNTVNPLSNSQFYIDNLFYSQGFLTEANALFQYDGHTVVMTASMPVQCNTTYHLKIGICNTNDHLYDPAVFLKRGTISSSYAPPGPLTIAPSPVCAGEEITLTVQGDPTWNYTWSTGQSGVGLQTITTTASLDQNSYSVTGEYLSGCVLTTASPAALLTVHNPANSPPQCLGVNGTGVYTVTTQVGEQICFTIPTSDAANEEVDIDANSSSIVGASFIGNGALQETGTFCWTPSMADVGFHTLNVLLRDNNTCEELDEACAVTIKVVCDFCPVRVYYENRAPDFYPLPALTVAGESITAGYSVDANQQDGNVLTGDAPVEFRAPYIDLQPGFIAGPGFLAVVDPNTCLEDCDICCDGWGGFTVDTYGEGTHNVLYNVMSPNGDGINDRWEVDDTDNPYCAYGAMAYKLEFFGHWGLVYRKEENWAEGCCPFRSWSPSDPVVSSIHWDGTTNIGSAFCYGCPVPSSVYNYILTLTGCNGQITYTGNVQLLDSQAGMIAAPIPPMEGTLTTLVADSMVTDLPDETIAGAVVAGVEDTLQQPILHLRPNPATDQVWLEYAPGLAQVWLLDVMGHRVLELTPHGAPVTILQVAGLAPALYSLMVLDIKGKLHNLKLIKQ